MVHNLKMMLGILWIPIRAERHGGKASFQTVSITCNRVTKIEHQEVID